MKVLIVFYSQYGHTRKLAESIAEGAQGVAGTDVLLRRVAEFPEVELFLNGTGPTRMDAIRNAVAQATTTQEGARR